LRRIPGVAVLDGPVHEGEEVGDDKENEDDAGRQNRTQSRHCAELNKNRKRSATTSARP
jgi:hypothetical protein